MKQNQTSKIRIAVITLVIVLGLAAVLTAILVPMFADKSQQPAVTQTTIDEVTEGIGTETAGTAAKTETPETEPETEAPQPKKELTEIKNIIFLIPDGAGFGSYDIANTLKTATGGGIKGQATPITHDAIAGKTVQGLYLDDYMIAAADTFQYHGSDDGPTDSTAAGTALLGGYKTNYLMCGVDHDANARANLLELCRLTGKATGVVTTKCLIDATPCAASVHLLRRPDQKPSYQYDANKQYMVNGLDVLLAYGSDGGYYRDGSLIPDPLYARDFGYTLVSDLSSLKQVVDSGAKKVFTNILAECSGEYLGKAGTDYQANHIKYDVYAKKDTELTLLEMAKGALKVLSENINDEDGFCLMIEGGAIDNACEGLNVKEGIGDYLAFDEVFGYCVNWAMQDGHTVVVACPDHDSGGFYGDPNGKAPKAADANGMKYDTMEDLVAALAAGTVPNWTKLAGATNGHSGQDVPVWLYAPDDVREEILTNLGVPLDTSAEKVREGRFYNGTKVKREYRIKNSDISPAIVKAIGLPSFDEATESLFYQVNKDGTFGTYDEATETFTFKNGETVKRNSNYWTDTANKQHEFACGFSLYLTNAGDDYGGTGNSTDRKLHHNPAEPAGTFPNRFYVPKSALIEMGYLPK